MNAQRELSRMVLPNCIEEPHTNKEKLNNEHSGQLMGVIVFSLGKALLFRLFLMDLWGIIARSYQTQETEC